MPSWKHMMQDLRYALRMFAKSPGSRDFDSDAALGIGADDGDFPSG